MRPLGVLTAGSQVVMDVNAAGTDLTGRHTKSGKFFEGNLQDFRFNTNLSIEIIGKVTYPVDPYEFAILFSINDAVNTALPSNLILSVAKSDGSLFLRLLYADTTYGYFYSAAGVIANNTTVQVKLVKQGTVISIYVGGILQLTVSDAKIGTLDFGITKRFNELGNGVSYPSDGTIYSIQYKLF